MDADGRARRHALYDLAFDVGLAHGVELAPLVIEKRQLDELKARERRIAFAIEQEGIPPAPRITKCTKARSTKPAGEPSATPMRDSDEEFRSGIRIRDSD